MGKKDPAGTSRAWRSKFDALPAFKGGSNDLIILFMGPTGVGKSTFISKYTGNDGVVVGHELKSCTRDVAHYMARAPPTVNIGKKRLVLVDTPGFDDTFADDSEILKRVAAWLAQSYNSGAPIAGIVYMNDITQKRMFGSTRTNLNMFSKLCGTESFHNIVLATSQWDLLGNVAVGEQREKELTDNFWAEVVKSGAKVKSIRKETDRGDIIASILQNFMDQRRQQQEQDVLRIQKEIVDFEKSIPATKAGQELKYTLEELLKLQKASMSDDLDERERQELEKKQKQLKGQISTLKLSLGEFFKKFFGLL